MVLPTKLVSLTHSCCAASERRENTLTGFKNLHLTVKIRIWPWLSCVCHIRPTAVRQPPFLIGDGMGWRQQSCELNRNQRNVWAVTSCLGVAWADTDNPVERNLWAVTSLCCAGLAPETLEVKIGCQVFLFLINYSIYFNISIVLINYSNYPNLLE